MAGQTTLAVVTGRPAAPSRELTGEAPHYHERLSVPWWWWPPVLMVAVLLAVEVYLGFPRTPVWLPFLLTGPLALAYLVWLGRLRVGLADGELRVGDARLPVEFIGRCDVVQASGKRRALGPDLDPAAFVLHRGWVGPVVRVEVTDPADPTPYWVFSVRRPSELLAALGRG